MWVWRDDVMTGVDGGGWRLDASGTWSWDAPSHLERVGAGTGALREYAGRSAGSGDRAIAALGAPPVEFTPIFHAMTEDRTRSRRDPAGEWVGARVPEPHPGSGPFPVQDPTRGRALGAVPTVPPPPVEDAPLSAEDELRRRAERRRRPRAGAVPADGVRAGGGRHVLRREESVEGRHALRR